MILALLSTRIPKVKQLRHFCRTALWWIVYFDEGSRVFPQINESSAVYTAVIASYINPRPTGNQFCRIYFIEKVKEIDLLTYIRPTQRKSCLIFFLWIYGICQRKVKAEIKGERIGKLALNTSSNSAFPMMFQVDLPRTFPV